MYIHANKNTYISSESGVYCDIDPYVKPFFTTDPPQMTALYEFLSYCLRVFHVLITLSRVGKINSNASICLGQAVHTIGLKSESRVGKINSKISKMIRSGSRYK
jgi:hypothetical protein